MSDRVDFYASYETFEDKVLADVRAATFDVDFGQNSWTTAAEFDRLVDMLEVGPGERVLDVASGSGGPAVRIAARTGASVTGIEISEAGVERARAHAAASGVRDRVDFVAGDAAASLPFEDGRFGAIVCIDALNHLAGREAVLAEWRRVLRPGGRIAFTDPIVLTGPVSNEELARRTAIGFFLVVPPGYDERLLDAAGFDIVQAVDSSPQAAALAGRWRDTRAARRDDLVRIEGAERFEATQAFFDAVADLAGSGRLSRMAYVARARGA